MTKRLFDPLEQHQLSQFYNLLDLANPLRLEYHYKNHSPEFINHQNWGTVTGEVFPPHTLIKDYGSLQKIFLSRNYYVLIDINENQLKKLSRNDVQLNIVEIKSPELEAQLVASSIA